MKRDDVIREVMSMRGCGYQVAKSILKLSEKSPAVTQKIGSGEMRRPMTQREAERIIVAAKQRIELVDEGG